MSDAPIRVAIVGAGPAGFYAAETLLDAPEGVFVDLYDRLPTPHGLVRSGVAPDHPKIKSVTKRYEQTADHERFRFRGHVEIGRDISHADLAAGYHAVLYSTGAAIGRDLGIPGEHVGDSVSATEFVAWYNGHPDARDLVFNLDHTRAVVVGNGNVALDVARMLMVRPELLAATDVADHALQELSGHGIEEVVVLGRRGPAEAAFTTPELRELEELTDATVLIEGGADLSDPPDAETRVKKNLEVIRRYAENRRPAEGRTIVMRFLASPVEILGTDRVEAVRIERNRLEQRDGRVAAVGTGEFETLEAGLVVRSVGYRGREIDGVPFDERRGTIANTEGRVTDGAGGAPIPGLYAAGWVKRGPSGIIGTNKKDANATVAHLLEDLRAGRLPAPTRSVEEIDARLNGHPVVDLTGWRAIDAHERGAGDAAGRPRVKLTTIAEMLERAERVTAQG